jgi:hypothetical protein
MGRMQMRVVATKSARIPRVPLSARALTIANLVSVQILLLINVSLT